MKKVITILITLCFCFSLWACNDTNTMQYNEGSTPVLESTASSIHCTHDEWTHATCQNDGCCTKCGLVFEQRKSHNYTDSTCTEASACRDCGTINSPAHGHLYSLSNHGTMVCSICGYTDPSVPVRLSAICDRILASGTDANGSVFELVANEEENYNGTTIEIGIIKDNAWSVPLTTDSPFIGENGLLYQSYQYSAASGSIYDEQFAVFRYIGNGCFYYENRILNGNNGYAYYSDNGFPVVQITETEWIVNNDGMIILRKFQDNFRVLDTNTMQIRKLDLVCDGYNIDYCAPLSEGLFACMNAHSDVQTNGFYDINGNKVIDLSGYTLATNSYDSWGNGTYIGPTQKLVFENGTCTFMITNDQGTDYYITIDKTGSVIKSEKA